LLVGLSAVVVAVAAAGRLQAGPLAGDIKPRIIEAAAFDTSKPLRELARTANPSIARPVREDRGPVVGARTHAADGALQSHVGSKAIPGPLANFEGLSNQDNFNAYGFRVNPPDTNGDVGPNNYVEMVNLVFAIYDKTGNRLLGPTKIGALWDGFAIPDCTDASGDPVVLYDPTKDRWILTQFTTRDPGPFYNCVAVSATGDPTGSYHRYAFITQPASSGYYFPDYPKYGVWSNTYTLTTRDFGATDDEYGISVYALEKKKMLKGKPARAIQFFLDSREVPINLIGDGLLPADVDAKKPAKGPIPIIGSQDDQGPYGATFDALNVWELTVNWRKAEADLQLKTQLPVTPFDSDYPCGPDPRDCLPQPGISNPSQYLDFLGYRQRVTWRLAYRKFKGYESMVTNQSVEAMPSIAGDRWYEIRRTNGAYTVHQQGTYAPNDGVHRWMGSIAQDKKGNMALGYSVVNGVNVFPGIRYTGRQAGDPLGQMTLGEGVVVNGTGVQTNANSRWGDYTSMSLDPTDECTFWYANEYYTQAGQNSSSVGWQTRIASFKLPDC
jgi:hypothetical protein